MKQCFYFFCFCSDFERSGGKVFSAKEIALFFSKRIGMQPCEQLLMKIETLVCV